MNSEQDAVNVFNFMLLRSPKVLDREYRRRNYITDDSLSEGDRQDADLFSEGSLSWIGKLIYNKVFCDGNLAAEGSILDVAAVAMPSDLSESMQDRARDSSLWAEVLQTLNGFSPTCPYQGNFGQMEALRDRNFIQAFQKFFVIPDRLSDIDDTLCRRVDDILRLLRNPSINTDSRLDAQQLRKQLRAMFDDQPLYNVFFDRLEGEFSTSFTAAKRKLFDTLYLLYVLRRYTKVNLEEIIEALGALHTLEALAWDEFFDRLITRQEVDADDLKLYHAMQSTFPKLRDWDLSTGVSGFPLISSFEDINSHLSAKPIIHPLFARLHRFRRPFNSIRPLGIGDLKVVKQWLCKYQAGEIAYIENVLEGEEKTRVHRRLEKAEDTYSSTDERQEETQRDTQSTDRFELKREAEQIIKNDLNVNANANLTYNGGMVVVTAGAGMAYTRSQTDQVKTAANYSREIIDKAVKRVQNRASEQRTSSRLFETEETNTHGFKNPAGKGHISGIYRWLDKVYRAQLFNYGRRMMFEFVLPEPAAFLVESRLRAFEANLDVPVPPTPPVAPTIQMPVTSPGAINKLKFEELRLRYDLSAFEYPTESKTIAFIDPATGQPLLQKRDLPDDDWSATSYRSDQGAKGYQLVKLIVDGFAEFRGKRSEPVEIGDEPDAPKYINTLWFSVNGNEVHREENNRGRGWPMKDWRLVLPSPLVLNQDEVTLTLGVQDGNFYSLTVRGELTLSDVGRAEWQNKVYNAISAVESAKAEKEHARLQQAYEARMSTYRNRVEQLRSVAINDLLQGQSPAFNRDTILTELKRQCLAMLAKEFDYDDSDDLIGKIDAVGELSVDSSFRRFTVMEVPNSDAPTSVTAVYEKKTQNITHSLPKLEETTFKGRYIQFLEQAFEWNQLAYVTYPYFWATRGKWFDLMNRHDPADPAWGAFLRAGSVKVLLAVTPAYDDSVLHFLATGEPWEGGPAPVIGDPLYLPLYEELRKQQDDLAGATAEGDSWTFTVPTSLVYLENSSTQLPPSACTDLP